MKLYKLSRKMTTRYLNNRINRHKHTKNKPRALRKHEKN